jgi:hypothetical protein
MRWLRRVLLLAALWWLAVVALRRAHDDVGDELLTEAPQWPPLDVADVLPRVTPADAAAPAADLGPAAASIDVAARADAGRSAAEPVWLPPVDGECPDGYPVKVAKSGIYHLPGGRSYDRTHPQRCYARAEDADGDGYRRAKL